jgi:polar amino acid transport system permease protein
MSQDGSKPGSGLGTGGTNQRIVAKGAVHVGRWVATAVVVVIILLVAQNVATNPRFHWSIVAQYFVDPTIIGQGVVLTLELTAITMVLGSILGVVLAVMRLSPVAVVSMVASGYIWLFRGTPVLVQLLFWYNIAALYPQLDIGIPFTNIVFIHGSANVLISQFTAAVLGLALNEAAYMAEIVRAGILSVDEGQVEAAASLGMTRLKMMRVVILPQAMRVIVPPTGNETISMLKTTSLASVIGLQELTYTAQIIYSRNFQTIPLLIVASIWYLIIVSILSILQYYLERYFARGALRELPLTPFQRFRQNLLKIRPHAGPKIPATAGGRQ